MVLLTKKDEGQRLCVDYRKVNALTVPCAYLLPRIDDSLNALSGTKWFSTLDLAANRQVPMDPYSSPRTPFRHHLWPI